MLRTITIDLNYQPLIEQPPFSAEQLHQKACAGDSQTIGHWRKTWIDNYKAAKDRFGTFADKSFGQLYAKNKHKPAIVIGSGPSLQGSIEALRDNKKLKEPLMTISCLHNFGYFEDEGCQADYYLSLDAGPIVMEDIAEGREHDLEYYLQKTENVPLIAYISSDPKLFEHWRGPIYLFNSPIPDPLVIEEIDKVEPMHHYISSGGNALGACMYTAKAVMGSHEIIYVGADFCFSWDDKFHAYDTHYDSLGTVNSWPDIFGIPRKSWPSYINFKFWFDKVAFTVPGRWTSCSEGILGAYREGNMRQFKYCSLKDAIYPYKMAETVVEQERLQKPDGTVEIKGTRDLDLEEFWATTTPERPLTLF